METRPLTPIDGESITSPSPVIEGKEKNMYSTPETEALGKVSQQERVVAKTFQVGRVRWRITCQP